MKTVLVLCTALTVFQVLDVSIASAITLEASADNNGETKIVSEIPEIMITTDQTENKGELGQNSVREDKSPNEENLENKLAEEQKKLEVAEEAVHNIANEQIIPEEKQHHEFESKIEELGTDQDVMHKEVNPIIV